MPEPQPFNPPVIVDPRGRPVKVDKRCPGCSAAPDLRVPSCGFGSPHSVCSRCGHEFIGERDDG